MNKFIKIILLTIVFVMSANLVFAQTNAETVVAKRPLSELDCKFILSETCSEILFDATETELRSYFGERFSLRYQKSFPGTPVFSLYSVGLVSEIDFYKEVGNISSGITWDAKSDAIIKKFGVPKSQSKRKKSKTYDASEEIYYADKQFYFENGKLTKVTLINKLSETEAAAVKSQHLLEKLEAEKAANTPEAIERKKQQMEADYNELLNQLDAKNQEGERIVNSEKLAIAAGGMFKDAVQKKIDKVRAAGDSLIDSFNKKYQGMIPAWMVKGIQEKWRPISPSQE